MLSPDWSYKASQTLSMNNKNTEQADQPNSNHSQARGLLAIGYPGRYSKKMKSLKHLNETVNTIEINGL